jgi:hypothetical protein
LYILSGPLKDLAMLPRRAFISISPEPKADPPDPLPSPPDLLGVEAEAEFPPPPLLSDLAAEEAAAGAGGCGADAA